MTDVLFEMGADGESVLATIEEISAAFQSLQNQVSQVAASASGLSVFDDILTAINDLTASVASGFSILDGSLMDLDASVNAVSEAITTLDTNLRATIDTESGVATGADNAASQIGVMGAAAETTTGAMEALQAAQGPLMMIGMGAIMAGKSLFDMGTKAQDAIALTKGMAGATDQDIQNLEVSAQQLGVTMDVAATGFYDVASAGYSGQAGVTVMTDAMEAAKGGGANFKDVASALTSELAAYGVGADQAGNYTDMMVKAVVQGKQSFQDFASAIGPLAATGHNVGLSFAEVASAEATLTQINPNVRQDANELRFLFNAMDMSIDKVSATAGKLSISFDKTHYASLDLIGKLKYLADISGGTNTVAFSKLVGGVNGVQAAMALLNKGGDVYTGNLAKIRNSQGATDKAFQTSQGTISAHMDKLGATFSVVALKIADAIGPKLIPIIDNISTAIGNFANFVSTHVDQMMPVLVGLAAFLGGIMVAALVAFAASMIAATWPILLIITAISALAAGAFWLYQHWSQVVGWFQGIFGNIQRTVQTATGDILGWITDTFTNIKNTIFTAWSTIASDAQNAWSGLLSFLQGILNNIKSGVSSAIQGVIGWFDAWKPAIITVASILGVVFGPALIRSGIQATIAGAQIASNFIANLVLTGSMAVANGAKLVATFVASMVTSGATAIANGAKITATFIASMIQSGSVAVIQGAQIAANFIVSLIASGTEAATTAGVFLTTFIPSVIASASTMIGTAIPAIISVIAGMVGYAVAGWAAAAATIAATWPFLLLAAVIAAVVVGIIAAIQHWSAIVHWFQSVWQSVWGAVSGFFVGIWDRISSFVSGAWSRLKDFAVSAWQGVSSVFSNAWNNYIVTPLTNVWHSISGFFKNLIDAAFKWGADFLNGFVNGVKSIFAGIGGVFSNIAGGIASFFHHSTPEEGPLKGDDQWGYEMMDNFITGIRARKGELSAAAQEAAQAMSGITMPSLNVGGGALTVNGNGGGGIGSSGAHIALLSQILTAIQQQNASRGIGGSNVTQTVSNTFHGVPNIQAIYQELNRMAGLELEYGQRGAQV